MILHGNQRGGGKDLALHLMKPENERVEVHELRGFVSDTLIGAFRESYAISKATRCKQHLYSLSINPPKNADISDAQFMDAVERAESKLGLTGQPRAVVFHDKRGDDGEIRRHAHAVWCRIDTDRMKAVALSYTKLKLRDVSRDLHIEHGLTMPPGLVNSKDRNPRNFTLIEWQQCKRAKKNVHEVKDIFRDCWAVSDSKAVFAHALEEQGYILAKGERGHIAVDHKGEKFAVSRYVGIRAKQVREKLGDTDGLPTIEQAHERAAKQVTERLKELRLQEAQALKARRRAEAQKKKRLLAMQAREAGRLREEQAKRLVQERAERAARLRKGLLGALDRITGRRKKTIEENREEAARKDIRDAQEKCALELRQAAALSRQREKAKTAGKPHRDAVKELTGDIKRLSAPPGPSKDERREAYIREQKSRARRPRRARSRDGPGFER